MALQREGIQAVVKGISKFLGDIGKMNRAYDKLAKSSNKAGQTANRAGKQTFTALQKQTLAFANLTRAQSRHQDALRNYDKAYQSAVRSTKNQEQALERLDLTQDEVRSSLDALTNAEDQYSDVLTGAVGAQTESTAATVAAIPVTEQLGAVIAGVGVALSVVLGVIAAVVVAWKAFTGAINFAIGIVRKFIGVIQGIISLFQRLLSVVQRALSPITSLFRDAFSFALGNLVTDGIRGIRDKLKEIASEALGAVAAFQKLNIQFDALIARDYSKQWGVPMSEAFELTIGKSEQLLSWIKQIAVTTPFTVRSLTDTLAMANAMGLVIPLAKRLTLAVGNFTAAMGLSEDHMFRIIYNFGQMLAQGKLNGREFRDLANSFIPVNELLRRMAEGTGMTTQEFKKFAFEGGVPVQQFFDEFINMAEHDFPNAMERMARTWQGVSSNIKDFFQVIVGVEVLGPLIDNITASAAKALDRLLTPAVRRNAEMIGETLLNAYLRMKEVVQSDLVPALKNLAAAFGFTGFSATKLGIGLAKISAGATVAIKLLSRLVNWIAERLGAQFNELNKSASTWGENIIISLANGMAAAAVYVVRVINQIASIIANWLSPGSPPKALPDLPKWGMAAMAEWLRGMTTADFDVLKGIQGPLKSVLDLLAQTGKIGENAAGKIFRKISVAIAKALSTGQVDEGLFEKIAAAAGPFGKELAELARRYIKYAEAVEKVEAAELRLKEAQEAVKRAREAAEAAREREERSRVALASSIREYNRQLRSGASKAVLNARLAEIRAGEQAAKQATKQRKDAEKGVDEAERAVEAAEAALAVAEEYLAVIREQLEVQKQLVDQLLDITKAQIIEIKLDTAAGGGAGAAVKKLADDWGGALSKWADYTQTFLDSEADRLLEQMARVRGEAFNFDDVFTQAERDVEAWVERIGDQMVEIFTPLKAEVETFGSIWDSLFGDPTAGLEGTPIELAGAESGLDVFLGKIENLTDTLSDLKDAIIGVNNVFAPGMKDNLDSISNSIGILTGGGSGSFSILRGVMVAAQTVIFGLGFSITWLLAKYLEWKAWNKELRDDISEFLSDIWEGFKTWSQNVGDTIAEFLLNASQAFVDWFRELFYGSIIKDGLADILQGFIDFGTDLYTEVTTKLGEISEAWTNFWYGPDGVVTKMTSAITEAIGWILSLGVTFDNFRTNALSLLTQAIGWLNEKLQSLKSWIDKINLSKLEKISKVKKLPKGGDGDDTTTNIPKNAAGGRITGLSLVGEQGPELYSPRRSGFIFNQQQIADLFSSIQSRAMGYSHATAPVAPSSVNVHMNVNIYDQMSEAEFASKVERVVMRSIGGR